MFSVCVAAAVGTATGANAKTNLLFQFEQPPSASQVMSRSITAFSQLQQERGNFNEFFVNCAMIFDDNTSRWVPLERSNQITHNCQVYLFQPDVPDVAGPIPDPVPADSFLNSYVSPARSGAAVTQHHSARGLMPRDPDLSSFQQRDVPTQNYNNSSYSQPNNRSLGGGYGSGSDDALTREQREILRREAERYGSGFVAGDSILKEERDKEERKIVLPIDTHRDLVRTETKRFAEEVSPSRSPNSSRVIVSSVVSSPAPTNQPSTVSPARPQQN
jgi:hypothetical protein